MSADELTSGWIMDEDDLPSWLFCVDGGDGRTVCGHIHGGDKRLFADLSHAVLAAKKGVGRVPCGLCLAVVLIEFRDHCRECPTQQEEEVTTCLGGETPTAVPRRPQRFRWR